MTFDQLPPNVQRAIFMAAELIREDPRTAQEYLVDIYETGFNNGRVNGLDHALTIINQRGFTISK